jgi:hypothetical protein
MKIYCYIHVGKDPYPQDVPQVIDKFHVLAQYNLFNLAPTGLERCQSVKYCVYQTIPLLTYVLTANFFFRFFIPQTANNPILYAATVTLRIVAFPGFLIVSGVSQIVNVMCLDMTVSPGLLILGFMEATVIAH